MSESLTTSGKNASQGESGISPPLDRRRTIIRLVGGGLMLALGLSVVGWGIVKLLKSSSLTRWEDSVNIWFFDNRNPTINGASHVGSYLAETVTCIAILVVLFFAFRWWLGRWRDSFVLLAAIVGELLVFLIVTAVVNRARPDVPHLDVAPSTSSFPSGHTAAAVALYGCIAVIVLRNLQLRWVAISVAVICCVLPFVVGVSRLYRGMHHPTDVLFGALGGGIWLLIVLTTLLPRPGAPSRSRQAVETPGVAALSGTA